MKKRVDYPRKYIIMLLENYGTLADGKWPFQSDAEIPAKKHSFRSPFENATIAKADIDRAVDSLGWPEEDVIKFLYLGGKEIHFDEHDIQRIERNAIRHMGNYLNGECVLERWAKENGMESHGNIYEPNYLTDEMHKYMADICLKYCVLEGCPE